MFAINGNLVNKYSNGGVYEFSLPDGYTYEAYVPDNYSASTPVMIYEHGDNRGYYNDWRHFSKKFETDGCNSIVIRADRYKSVELYNDIVQQYGLDSNMGITVSFSGGTTYSMREVVEMAKQNPNAGPQLSVIIDGYTPVPFLEKEGTVDKLVDSDTIVLAFGGRSDNGYTTYYEKLAKECVNTIIFVDKLPHEHNNKSFTQEGLLEYTLGEASLPDHYDIKVYDSERGKFVTLDYSQVSNIDKVYNYFGFYKPSTGVNKLSPLGLYELTSDAGVVNSYLNDIMSKIRETSFLGSSFESSGASTTNVLKAIPPAVSKYFTSIINLLNVISKTVNDISTIDPAYQTVDKVLGNTVDEDNI